jgi:RNA polymerase-binding transcription factor DksA
MEAMMQKLYSELRDAKKELTARLNQPNINPVLKAAIDEEIHDIDVALKKMNTGDFGKCEVSGELIPPQILKVIPTIKTLDEIQNLSSYLRKPLYS